jgi:hypothetical protein
MKKSYLGIFGLILTVGLSACSNPFAKPLTFEQAYEALMTNDTSLSLFKSLQDMKTTDQTSKVNASFTSAIGSGSVALDFSGKGTVWSGLLDSSSDGTMSFSADINAPIMGGAPENVKAGGKLDFKMVNGKIYVRVADIKASSANTTLSDQIGATVGMVNGTLWGKWIVIDIAKYESLMKSGAMSPLTVSEMYQLQKTWADLIKKYPILKNNGEITEGDKKGYAVSLNNENILSMYSELTKDPVILKLLQSPKEEDLKEIKSGLEETLKNVQLSGKLFSAGNDDITLAIDSLKFSPETSMVGTIAKKDSMSTAKLTISNSTPHWSGSGTDTWKVIIDLTGNSHSMTGKLDVVENEKILLTAQGGFGSKLDKNSMNLTGDIRVTGNFLGSLDTSHKDEFTLQFEQSVKIIPSFTIEIPEGARSIEEIMKSFGLEDPSSKRAPTIEGEEETGGVDYSLPEGAK